MKYQTYEKVKTLNELKQRIQDNPEHILPIAGATDIMVKARARDWYQEKDLIDLTHIPEMKGITETSNLIRIGALVTADEILHSEVIKKHAEILHKSCTLLAGPQIRNRATIGGNLANACLAGDMIPALCVLKAFVHTISSGGERDIPVWELLKRCPACLNHEEMSVGGCYFGIPAGKKTVLDSGEIITQIYIPKMSGAYRISFQKIGRKQIGCMSKFTLAIAMHVENEKIADLRMSIGAAFSDISLLEDACSIIIGQRGSKELFTYVAEGLGDQIEKQLKSPNESLKYKAEVCRRLTARTLMELYLGESV